MLANAYAPAVPVSSYYFGPGWQLCCHLNVVHSVRELVCAILHNNVPSALTVQIVQKATKKIKALQERGEDRMVTPAECSTLRAVLQTVQSIDYVHHTPVTREGQAAVYALKCAVFGDVHLTENVLELVAFGSMTRAQVFRQACLAVLKALICSSNCFHMMGLGYATGCKDLEQAATMFVLQNFGDAMQRDRGSFLELEEESVTDVLQNAHLQAGEAGVLAAALAWVRHSPAQRRRALPRLLESVVQLEELSPMQLSALMQEPLVKADPAASKVVSAMCFKRALLGTSDTAQQQNLSDALQHNLVLDAPNNLAADKGRGGSAGSKGKGVQGAPGQLLQQQQQQQQQQQPPPLASPNSRMRMRGGGSHIAAVH